MKKNAIMILCFLFLLIVVPMGYAGDGKSNSIISYTPSTITECIKNTCTKTIYSGVRFINEDATWKTLEQARSFKNKGFDIHYLENDKLHDMEVVDFNFTNIIIKPFVTDVKEINKDIPIKIDNEIISTSNLNEINIGKTTTVITTDNIFIHNYTFGEHSTTIEIILNNTNLMADIELDWYNVGTNTNHSIGLYKFNITSIYAEKINYAYLFINQSDFGWSGNPGDIYNMSYFPNQTWDETSLVSSLSLFTRANSSSTTRTSNGTYFTFNTTSQLNNSYRNGDNNFSVSVSELNYDIYANNANVVYNKTGIVIGRRGVTNYWRNYTSREGNILVRPVLLVNYDMINLSSLPSFIILTTYSPSNTTYVGNSSVLAQYLVSYQNAAVDKCWYKLDNGGTNTTMAGCANTSVAVTSLGLHTLNISVNGTNATGGELRNTTSINFTITNNAPTITQNGIGNTTYYDNTTINNQFLVTHTGVDTIDKCWYKLNSNANVTGCSNATVNVNIGTSNLTVCANDTWGYGGCTQVNFSIIRTQTLSVTVQSPGNASYVGNSSILAQYLVNKGTNIVFDKCWYSLDGGTNTTMTNCVNTTIPITSLGDHALNVSVNGTNGTATVEIRNTTMVKFTITNTAPTTTNQIPSNTSYIGNTTVNYAFTVSHSGVDLIDKCWYKVDSTSNVTTCNNGTFGITTLGLHNFTSCVNDTWGGISCTQTNFSITNTAPTITITSIANTTYSNLTYQGNFYVTHPGADLIDKCWYKSDTSANVTGCGNFSYTVVLGSHNLTVCANDTWGYGGCSQVNYTNTFAVVIYYLLENNNNTITENVTLNIWNVTTQTILYDQGNFTQLNYLALPENQVVITGSWRNITRKLYVTINSSAQTIYMYFPNQSCNYIIRISETSLSSNYMQNVLITGKTFVNGSLMTVFQTKTQSDAYDTLYVIPNVNYKITFEKTGYPTRTEDYMFKKVCASEGTYADSIIWYMYLLEFTNYTVDKWWIVENVTAYFFPNSSSNYNGSVSTYFDDADNLNTYVWLNVTQYDNNGTKTTFFYSNLTNNTAIWDVNISGHYGKFTFRSCFQKSGTLFCMEANYINMKTTGIGNINFWTIDLSGGLSTIGWKLLFLVLLGFLSAILYKFGGANAVIIGSMIAFAVGGFMGIWGLEVLLIEIICMYLLRRIN